MPRIAFWNINTGRDSFDDRIITFQTWCATELPDLLLLEEVSHTIERNLPGWTGMSEIKYVNTLDKNLDGSTKQLWALQSVNNQWNFQGTPLRLPELKSKRMLLKVTMKNRVQGFEKFALWVIHANASPSGGAAAVRAVRDYLDSNPEAVVGGDFNCPIASALPEAVAPLSWQNNNMNFTQWNKEDGDTRGPNVHLHLVTPPPIGPVMYSRIDPHNVIDYVMLGRNRQAMSRANCANELVWRDILTNFDHCPVMYNLA